MYSPQLQTLTTRLPLPLLLPELESELESVLLVKLLLLPPHPVRNRLAAMVMAQVKANAFFN